MRTTREVVLVAQDLFHKVGADGATMVAARSETLDQLGDPEMSLFWRRVARAMRLMAGAPSSVSALQHAAEGGPDRRSAVWPLMQRIEGFRHLATEAERKAGIASSEACAEDFRGIASGWRALVADLEDLAEEGDAGVAGSAAR